MSSITETRTLVDEIVDNADERELWIVGREFERPPYFIAGKGGDTRLARALRVCVENRIMPNSDGTYMVEGSEHRTYRVGDSCSCPNSQKSRTKWCYHMVAVALYVEWQRRLRPMAPVALGTLRAGTLPLPPVTVDERLAREPEGRKERGSKGGTSDSEPSSPHSLTPLLPSPSLDERLAQAASVAMDHVYDALPVPEEDRMPDDDSAYIPEPYDAPVAILEAGEGSKGVRSQGGTPDSSVPPHSLTPSLPSHSPAVLPSLDAHTLEQSMQAYAAQRQVVTRYIKEQMSEGVDYYTLTIKGHVSKATLSKAGSEKFLSLFQLSAQFQQDEATWRMLGSKDGLLCYTCHLVTRSGEVVGEGRGARNVRQDGGDINKAIKMATKSAQVDAVLRTGALSDVFTQDLEPETPEEGSKGAGTRGEGRTPNSSPHSLTPSLPSQKPTSQDLRQRIWAMVQAQAPDMRTREQVETWINAVTRYTLHPDNYQSIIVALEARA